MEQNLAALAAAAATTLVQMMTTDGWEQAKAAVLSAWRRAHPSRVDMVGDELEAARLEMLAAREAQDEQVELDLRDKWGARLRRLLAVDPQAIAELRQLVERFTPRPSEVGMTRTTSVKMQAKASGQGRVYQAARDQKITGR